jgi:hypothetical protein
MRGPRRRFAPGDDGCVHTTFTFDTGSPVVVAQSGIQTPNFADEGTRDGDAADGRGEAGSRADGRDFKRTRAHANSS